MRHLLFLAISVLTVVWSSAESNVQTNCWPIYKTNAIEAAFVFDADSFTMDFETSVDIPFSESTVSMLIGMSGFAFTLNEDEYIYRSLKTDCDGGFIDSPTTGATRGGEKGCRIPTSSGFSDISPDADGNVGPDITGDDGLSVFNKEIEPRNNEVTGKVKVSDLPDGLGLSDPDDDGHQHVIPTEEMSFEDYQNKLNSVPWEKVEDDDGSTGIVEYEATKVGKQP